MNLLKLSAIATLSWAATTMPINAQSQSDITFSEGAVLLMCVAPGGADAVSDDLFEATFPVQVTNLQKKANDGTVVRVHYLGELKAGMFIVVGGDDIATARVNADSIQQEFRQLLMSSMSSQNLPVPEQLMSGTGPCERFEIGPVAVLPQ